MYGQTIPPIEENPLRPVFDAVLDKLSNRIAGGRRVDASDLLPGADDPGEGIVPDNFIPEVDPFSWFDPMLFGPGDPMTAAGLDYSAIPASGPGRDGDGLDFFRSGEAPSNYANRNNALYRSRRDFAVAITPKIEDMFGVSAHGSAGYLRPPSSGDAAPGGRSSNSDHYSGGAVDFFGTVEELDQLRAWLVTQPFVSFVRWRTESHGGASGTEAGAHLHASFDIGWVAKNYYQGGKVPPITVTSGKTSPKPPRQPSGGAESDAGEVNLGGGRRIL